MLFWILLALVFALVALGFVSTTIGQKESGVSDV